MPNTVQNLIPESQNLVTAKEDMTIQYALELMIEHDFSQLPVVDDDVNFKLRGLVTSDSILRTVSYFKSTLDKIKVSHAINTVKTCREDDELSELLNGLKDASAIPIVDKSGKLIAIVTNYDTVQYYRQRAEDMMFAETVHILSAQSLWHDVCCDTIPPTHEVHRRDSGVNIKYVCIHEMIETPHER